MSGATLDVRFNARKVFLVLSSRGEPPARRAACCSTAGRWRRARRARTCAAGRYRSPAQRLYRLVSLPRVEDRTLRLRLPPGVTGYAFTFG